MAINESDHQQEITAELARQARRLAHSSRDVPNPAAIYPMIGNITETAGALAQSCNQLGNWHQDAIEGRDYEGEDPQGNGTGTAAAAQALHEAANAFSAALLALGRAHTATAHVRWVDSHEEWEA